jgi:hypothetical protein
MRMSKNVCLVAGGAFSVFAAVLHMGCFIVGASWYRLLGAGERIARMAERGHWYPPMLTGAIMGTLLVWAAYAFSGAGLIHRLPFLRPVLFLIGSIYMLRFVAIGVLMPFFPGNGLVFWIVTSLAAGIAGGLHLLGSYQIWKEEKKAS